MVTNILGILSQRAAKVHPFLFLFEDVADAVRCHRDRTTRARGHVLCRVGIRGHHC